MDTLPLPPRPDLGQYRRRTTDLVAAARTGDEHAVRAWAGAWLEAIVGLADVTPTAFVSESFDRAFESIVQRVREKRGRAGERFALVDAQFLVARAHGFESWSSFTRHVEGLSGTGDAFEAAADAVVGGDLAVLASLLRAHPGLIHARSARVHRAMLLHYVAANGVEDFSQQTPPNAVSIARALLAAGAAVDAPAETYGGGKVQTTMNLLVSSAHPAGAGVQPALVETLLDFGAAIDGPDDDGTPLMTALAFGYPDAADTLVRRGATIDNVLAAAALGRVDLVARLTAERARIRPSLVSVDWLGLSGDPEADVERAFVWACTYGRTAVVELLLEQGMDPGVTDGDRMTGLHWAAARKQLEVVELLIRRGAPLEARNRWGGTVLSSTVFFALQRPADGASYAAVLELLIASGADVRAVKYPTGNAAVDKLLPTR
jgi:ankyrin repeat protein